MRHVINESPRMAMKRKKKNYPRAAYMDSTWLLVDEDLSLLEDVP